MVPRERRIRVGDVIGTAPAAWIDVNFFDTPVELVNCNDVGRLFPPEMVMTLNHSIQETSRMIATALRGGTAVAGCFTHGSVGRTEETARNGK